MTSRCEGCLNVGLGSDIVSGHLFLLRHKQVFRLKESQYLGLCFKPQAISAAPLLTLSIYRGITRDYIGTGVVMSLEIRQSAGRGWLFHVLVALGLS